MTDRAPSRPILERLSPLAVLLISLLVSEIMTAMIVIGFSLLFRGEIAADYLITGAVTCLVVASLIVYIVQEHNRRLQRTRERLEATQMERDALQQQLLQAQKLEAIGSLAGGIAHDFNNLLAGVLSNASFLGTLGPQELTPELLSEVLDDIQEAAQRGATLSQQLLTFSRRQPVLTSSISVEELVEDVTRLQRRTFDKAIDVSTDIPAGLYVLGNKGQLEQVLMNLCLNARDAMPQGGQLQVRARATRIEQHPTVKDGSYVRVTVQDTGTGMDEDTLRQALDPFFTTKAPNRGSGLGLSVVYGIVRGHKGNIELASKPDEGCTATLLLPAGTAPELALDRATEPQQATMGPDLRLLLVDDEDSFRRSLCRVLRRRGFSVTAVPSGAEAIQAVQAAEASFDLVLLDVAMPGMDGEQTLAALRSLGFTAPALVMSGYDGGHRVERMLASGAEGFLRKPFDPSALDEFLRNIPDSRPAGGERDEP